MLFMDGTCLQEILQDTFCYVHILFIFKQTVIKNKYISQFIIFCNNYCDYCEFENSCFRFLSRKYRLLVLD